MTLWAQNSFSSADTNTFELDDDGVRALQEWANTRVQTEPVVKTSDTALWNWELSGESFELEGAGICTSATQLSSLNFKASITGEEMDEFLFEGPAVIHKSGHRPRAVRFVGRGAERPSDSSFSSGFDGYGFVMSETGYQGSYWDLFRVRGKLVVERPARRQARHHEPSRAYYAFKDLASWMRLSDDEMAQVLDISRTTPLASWKHGIEPREHAVARRLFQLYAVVRALRDRLGQDGLEEWLGRGRPYPLKLLLAHKWEQFERRADEVIFPRSDTPQPRLDAAWLPPAETAQPRSSSTRRPKRGAPVRSRRRER